MINSSPPITARLLILICSTWLNAAIAQVLATDSNNPFVVALMHGKSQTPLTRTQETEQLYASVARLTGRNEPLSMTAWRLERFSAQRSCGRVAFGVTQGNQIFSQLGGQLNICEDGRPPWKTCTSSKAMVPPESKCPDGSAAQDTPEIKAAIDRALASGSLSQEQVKATLKK